MSIKPKWLVATGLISIVGVSIPVLQWATAQSPKSPTLPSAIYVQSAPQYDTEPAKSGPVAAQSKVAPGRQLPLGVFTKKMQAGEYGSVSLTWDYRQDGTVHGLIQFTGLGIEFELKTVAEISVSSHGTIYGIITSAKAEKLRFPQDVQEQDTLFAFIGVGEGLMNEVMLDMPFSYQYRIVDDQLILHNFRMFVIGNKPFTTYMSLLQGDYSEMGIYLQFAGSVIEGTYAQQAGQASRKP